MLVRFVVFAILTVALATSGSAQGVSLRDKMNFAGDRACVLATHLHQLCSALQSSQTRRSVKRLMVAVCKPERAEQRIAIEQHTNALFGQAGDAWSCSARADALRRYGAEIRNSIVSEERQRQMEIPSS